MVIVKVWIPICVCLDILQKSLGSGQWDGGGGGDADVYAHVWTHAVLDRSTVSACKCDRLSYSTLYSIKHGEINMDEFMDLPLKRNA
jgi:hypothetical protein